jgi:hypothetical protein
VAGGKVGEQQAARIVGPVRGRPAAAVCGGGVKVALDLMIALVGEGENDPREESQQKYQGPGAAPRGEHATIYQGGVSSEK